MRRIRTVLLIIADIFLVNMAHLLAINITFPDNFTHITTIYQHDFMVVSLVYIIAFLAAKMYHSLWDQTGTDEFLLGVSGGTVAGIVVVIYTRFIGATIPINVCVLGTVFSIVFVLGLRILYRVYRRALLYMPYKYSADQRRVMIVGAGSAGTMIINEMFSKRELKYNPVVLIDDDRYKRGKRIFVRRHVARYKLYLVFMKY